MDDKYKKFLLFTDEDWVDSLTKTMDDETLNEFFFKIKCAPLLKYISLNIYNSENYFDLLGEFYVMLSNNNWYILRQFRKKNNATLYSYLSRCAINHFLAKKRMEKRFLPLYADENPEIAKMLNSLTNEEYTERPSIMLAYEKLEERDKEFIRLLVLDGKSSLEAADQLWPYVKSSNDWRDMPVTRVQSTISMIKHRALFHLTTEIKNLK